MTLSLRNYSRRRVGGFQLDDVSVLIFDVISREPDLRLCTVSQVMSSAACLKLVSFFEMMR
jgi:hypothetical protein